MFGIGFGNMFFLARGLLPLLGSNKQVIGISSFLAHAVDPKQTVCTDVGNTVRILAHSLTGRLKRQRVAIGMITPKTVTARNDIIQGGPRVGGRVTSRATLNQINRPSSVKKTVTLLLSRRGQ